MKEKKEKDEGSNLLHTSPQPRLGLDFSLPALYALSNCREMSVTISTGISNIKSPQRRGKSHQRRGKKSPTQGKEARPSPTSCASSRVHSVTLYNSTINIWWDVLLSPTLFIYLVKANRISSKSTNCTNKTNYSISSSVPYLHFIDSSYMPTHGIMAKPRK